MFIKDLSYQVEFSVYCEKHFCKDFLRKYKPRQWIETKKTIVSVLERAYAFQNTNLIDTLKFSQEDGVGIFKLDFRVAGTNFSPKSSGNRVVFSLCNETGRINVLLVYGKDHCDKKCSETQWIFGCVKVGFPEWRKW
ncbi:MAG: hypothetical protein Q8P62_02500 [Candidatus Peregrinibacteria bacterium]|nr:hypothetical protein [Candidatus Peregrinibacteria bacterium]